MKFSIFYRGKKKNLDVKQVIGLGMGIGLTFKSRNTRNLLFDFGKEVRRSITSYFVFFSFLAVWLDSKNRVVEKAVIRPFRSRILPKKKFVKLVEVPINYGNRKILEFFDERGKV